MIKMSTFCFQHFYQLAILVIKCFHFFNTLVLYCASPREIIPFRCKECNNLEELATIRVDEGTGKLFNFRSEHI
jgi:hypothetical protein